MTTFPKIAADGPCSICGAPDSRCYDTTVPMHLCDTHAAVPDEPQPRKVSADAKPAPWSPVWSLAECRIRAAGDEFATGRQHSERAWVDRAKLLALLDARDALIAEMRGELERIEADRHVTDFDEEDRCTDDCVGCEAGEFLDAIDRKLAGGGGADRDPAGQTVERCETAAPPAPSERGDGGGR